MNICGRASHEQGEALTLRSMCSSAEGPLRRNSSPDQNPSGSWSASHRPPCSNAVVPSTFWNVGHKNSRIVIFKSLSVCVAFYSPVACVVGWLTGMGPLPMLGIPSGCLGVGQLYCWGGFFVCVLMFMLVIITLKRFHPLRLRRCQCFESQRDCINVFC